MSVFTSAAAVLVCMRKRQQASIQQSAPLIASLRYRTAKPKAMRPSEPESIPGAGVERVGRGVPAAPVSGFGPSVVILSAEAPRTAKMCARLSFQTQTNPRRGDATRHLLVRLTRAHEIQITTILSSVKQTV